MKSKVGLTPMFAFGPVFLLVAVSLVKELVRVISLGLARFRLELVIQNVLLVVGWVIGWVIIHLDVYLGKRMEKYPTISAVMKDWRPGVENMLTVLVVTVLGFWVCTSVGSPLGVGVMMGLSFHLYALYMQQSDYKSWYWVFSRTFSETEHKTIKIVWGLCLLVQLLILTGR